MSLSHRLLASRHVWQYIGKYSSKWLGLHLKICQTKFVPLRSCTTFFFLPRTVCSWFQFPDAYKTHNAKQECCTGVKMEPRMIGHQFLIQRCRSCLCLSVVHSGTCGFSYRMFYCSTMFLPWSSAHCIKATLSPDAHTGRACLCTHAHTHAHFGDDDIKPIER